jgi:hypothetical protein
MIWVSPGASFLADSGSGSPNVIAFLIRSKLMKYSRNPGGLKFDLLRLGWFNLCLDPFFKEIVNLAIKLLDLACSMCYIQNGDWDTGRGSDHMLRSRWFNLCLDRFFEENPNLNREI